MKIVLVVCEIFRKKQKVEEKVKTILRLGTLYTNNDDLAIVLVGDRYEI